MLKTFSGGPTVNPLIARLIRLPNHLLLCREPVETEPDRHANEDHMHQKTLDKATKLVRASGMQSTQWQNNQIHYQEESNSIKHAANHEVRFSEVELSACCTIDRRSRI